MVYKKVFLIWQFFLIIRYNLRKIGFISLIDICGDHKSFAIVKED